MKLTLDREDLLDKFKDINCSQTKIEHFKVSVQHAVIAIGKAQFREYDGSNYNAIYPGPAPASIKICSRSTVKHTGIAPRNGKAGFSWASSRCIPNKSR